MRLLIYKVLVAAVISGAAAYSFLIRETNFLLFSKQDKLLSLVGVTLLFLLIAIIVVELASKLYDASRGKSRNIILMSSIVIAVVISAICYKFPPFPQRVELEIARVEGQSGAQIGILAIERIDLPSGEVTPLKFENLVVEGAWLTNNDQQVFTLAAGEGGRLWYKNMVQGAMRVAILTGPEQGDVEVRFNGDKRVLTAYTEEPGRVEVELPLQNKWSNANRTRRLFLAGDILAKIVLLSFGLTLAGMGLYYGLVLRRVSIRGLGTVGGVVVLSLILYLLIGGMYREVKFADPGVEAVVREVIRKPGGVIYTHDLMSVIELDISGKGITRLEGIGELRNLRVLNAAGNEISDLAPLEKLVKLQKLNLRENEISDISPLIGLKQLMYLNLHSNEGITDITPIGEMRGLQTLILRNVPIGGQISVLEGLTSLKRLNLRNTSLTETDVLARLFSQGVLQDNAVTGKRAEVNLLDNPFDEAEGDPFAGMRYYWGNITYRYPVELPGFDYGVAAPEFMPPSGVFGSEIELVLTTEEEGGVIFYTLDGSEPWFSREGKPLDNTLVYVEPIQVRDRSGEPNVLADIEMSKWHDYRPASPVAKGTVVRAVVVNGDGQASAVVTHSYFVGERFIGHYAFPIASIVSAPVGLFSDETGIFVPGDLYEDTNLVSHWDPANYHQPGLKWERPGYLQLFDGEGNEVLRQSVGIRTHGGGSRSLPQKSIRLYAGGEYGDEVFFRFDFFPELN